MDENRTFVDWVLGRLLNQLEGMTGANDKRLKGKHDSRKLGF